MPLSANLQEILEWRGVEGLVCAEVLTDNDTDGYTTGPVFAIAGVAEISRTTSSSNEAHYYDNIPAVVISSTGSDELTISVSAIPMDVYAAITGQIYDDTTGSLIEGPRDFKYFALGYKTKKTNGDEVYVWRYKGSFNIPDQTNSTENDSTDANGQEIVYTGISTTHKFTKTGKGSKAMNVDVSKGLADVTNFFGTVTTPDSIGESTALGVTLVPSANTPNAVDMTITNGTLGGLRYKVGAKIAAPAVGDTVTNSQYTLINRNPYTITSSSGASLSDTVVVIQSTAQGVVEKVGTAVITEFSGGNVQPTPDYGELGELTVESAAGTTVGYTAISVSGYTMSDTVSYKYKLDSAAAEVAYDDVLSDGWTAWDGEDEIASANGQVITVAVVVTEDNKARAAGSCTVTVKQDERSAKRGK